MDAQKRVFHPPVIMDIDGLRSASGQAAKRIERFDPNLDKIIDTSQPIRELASGLGGPLR